MAYNLIITDEAEDRLIKATNYILFELKNYKAAMHLYDEVENIYDRLETNPWQFPLCQSETLSERKFRQAVLPNMNYRLIFKIIEQQVYVIGIFHDSENYSDKL
ncbi:MAG: type II toxin-antitoxin system RelE/ParE family toxin [Lachnospiraceae bacterium]|nr:type II toxin-antitoxin system RelE/ParE family toxin [Lachnospiraceae bacterium]